MSISDEDDAAAAVGVIGIEVETFLRPMVMVVLGTADQVLNPSRSLGAKCSEICGGRKRSANPS